MDFAEAMDQDEQFIRSSDETDIESEHEDQPPSSKRKFQCSATYGRKYDHIVDYCSEYKSPTF